MSKLIITEDSIPDLTRKTAIVTGGSSGIGLGAVKVLLDHNAHVFNLDVKPPQEAGASNNLTYIETDISSWPSLVKAFATITSVHKRKIDIAIGNAGVFEAEPYSMQVVDPLSPEPAVWSELEKNEPYYNTLEVNFKGTLNFVLLASRVMKGQGDGGSIVLTTSTTAYLAEQMVPVYSATKAALANLIRALRPTLPLHNIAISGVAPSAVESAMLPPELVDNLRSMEIPVCSGRHVGLALVYSATAMQKGRVEDYGKDKPVTEEHEERWNGKIIHAIGDEFYEVEEGLIETRGRWWGEDNVKRATIQRVVTDTRDV